MFGHVVPCNNTLILPYADTVSNTPVQVGFDPCLTSGQCSENTLHSSLIKIHALVNLAKI